MACPVTGRVLPLNIYGEPDYTGLKMTAREYITLGQTAARYELVDGVVRYASCPGVRHNAARLAIMLQLGVRESAVPDLTAIVRVDIEFDESHVYCPDVFAYAPHRRLPREHPIRLVPDLIIEITAPDTLDLDLGTKVADYDRFGVGEYWVLDPDTLGVRVWRREGGRFVVAPTAGERIESTAIPGVCLDLSAIRQHLAELDGEPRLPSPRP